jgi:hypothetical protein
MLSLYVLGVTICSKRSPLSVEMCILFRAASFGKTPPEELGAENKQPRSVYPNYHSFVFYIYTRSSEVNWTLSKVFVSNTWQQSMLQVSTKLLSELNSLTSWLPNLFKLIVLC